MGDGGGGGGGASLIKAEAGIAVQFMLGIMANCKQKYEELCKNVKNCKQTYVRYENKRNAYLDPISVHL